ncbi:phage tail protein [Marinobacter shengliensis]|uniref:phage tail protein n=1 Tax=Marinobacter shengliensis TaxID=1389223 RepID=UPI001E4BE778|nr:phage tail protein [Marinobacter shengliensis]MCD1631351.1 phage tail protein [Marinobacter shengliensis]
MEAQVDRTSLQEVRALLAKFSDGARRAHARSLNKTVTKSRTESSKEVRKQVRLNAAYVKSLLTITEASERRLQAKISTPTRGLLMSRFSTDTSISGDKVGWLKPPSVPPRGIRVKVKPTGGAKVFGGDEIVGKPFYMVLPGTTGRVAIVGRRATIGSQGGQIKVFYGPSLSQVFTDVKDDISEPLALYQMQQFEKEIDAILRGF